MTDYECDMKFNVRADLQEECLQNPSNPECYSKMREAGAVSGLGCLLFCFGCCCGYFIRPCYANHEKRKSETQAASRKKSTVGEAQWDYQPAPDGGRPVDHQVLGVCGHKPTRRSKTPVPHETNHHPPKTKSKKKAKTKYYVSYVPGKGVMVKCDTARRPEAVSVAQLPP